MWFLRRKNRRSAKPTLTREQAYAAKPMAVNTIERQPIGRSGQRLVVRLQPRGYQKWLLRVPDDARRTIDLDAAGIEVFDMCDGKTSVRQIIRRFARQHQIDPHEADVAVVTFIRMMMRKRLVYVAVEKTS